MADEKTPYEIVIRRSRYNRGGLDDLTAAGMVAARSQVDVTAVFADEEEGNHVGDLVPAIWAQVYEQDGRAVARWSSSELTWATARETCAMIMVLERAQAVAGLANAMADGVDPLQGGPSDRVVEEVTSAIGRAWTLANCTDASAYMLTEDLARRLARASLIRASLIRDRDGIDPLS